MLCRDRFFTYIDVGGRSRFFLLVKLLCSLFICWVLQIGSEKSEMLLFLGRILLFMLVKFGILTFHFLVNDTSISNSDVVVGAARNLLAHILQTLGRSTQLSNLLDLEAFSLFLHVLQKDAQVSRNSIGTLEVLDIIAWVKLLAQVFAHRFNVYNSFGESNIWLTGILETNRAKDFKLFILVLGIGFLFFFCDFDGLLILVVGDAIELFFFLFETTQVHRIVSNWTDSLNQSYTHTNTNSTLILSLRIRNGGFIQGKVVIHGFFTKIFKLIDELIDTFLSLLALGHLRAHTLLS